jgi:phage terminase Nu1 subunit (DNA packaging protein)
MMTPAELDRLVDRIAEAVAAKLASQPKLVDRHQLSEIIGVSVPSIERLQAAGRLPVVRVGRLVRYDVSTVIAALAVGGGDDE